MIKQLYVSNQHLLTIIRKTNLLMDVNLFATIARCKREIVSKWSPSCSFGSNHVLHLLTSINQNLPSVGILVTTIVSCRKETLNKGSPTKVTSNFNHVQKTYRLMDEIFFNNYSRCSQETVSKWSPTRKFVSNSVLRLLEFITMDLPPAGIQ